MTKRTLRLTHWLLLTLMAGYVIFFSIQLYLHYHSFGSRSLDLGNMDQAIWNTLHGRLFHQTNQPGATNRLSLHVEPILLPISLLYLIHSGPEILFICQSLIVALGAMPVFALARLKLNSEGVALIFALVYLLFPAIQGATLLDFHAVTLAPTFLLAAFYFLETRQTGRFALFAGLAVACKEDMTLLVLMLGVYAFLINRQYRLGTVTVALCLIWAFLAVFVIPPTFASTENIHWNRYGHLGDSPPEMLLNMVLEPGRYLAHLQAVDALGYFRQLLAPTAYLALLNPITLLLALPSFGINLLSNFPPMQRVNSLIYAAPTVPAVIISAIYGAANLKRGWSVVNGRWSVVSSQEAVVSRYRSTNGPHTPLTTHHAPRTTPYFTFFVGTLLLLATLLYHRHYGYLPGGGQFRGWEEVTEHHRRAAAILAQIPPEAALSAHDRLNPHVSQRETLYIFDRVDDADHIVLDITEDSWPLHPVALRDRVRDFLANDFGVVAANDGYLLLAKNRPELPTTLPDAFYDFARVTDPASFTPQFPVEVIFDDKLRLLGYDLVLGAHEANLPQAVLYWQALQPLDQDYALWPFFIDRNGQVIEEPRARPLVTTLWYPPTRWSPQEIIITRTLPWDLGQEFTLAVGVTSGDWTDRSQRLPINRHDESLYTLENNSWLRLGSFRRETHWSGRKLIKPVPVEAELPTSPVEAQFWRLIDLQGVAWPDSPPKAGEDLRFALRWQTREPLTIDLTTFAHLLDNQGNIVAQRDWTPQDATGYLPTSAWQPGRPVVDQQSLPLPADLPAGDYRLVIGWYYAVTGERLPLTAGEGTDTVEVGVVSVP